MRILFCNKYNFPFSGTEVYMFEAMELMRSRGHQVALFSMADGRGEATAYDRHFVSHVDFKSSNANLLTRAKNAARAIYSYQARQKLRKLIAEFHPDIAHVRNIYHHLSPSILWELKRQSIPVLYHLNDFKLICPSYNMVSRGNACQKCQGGKFWNVVNERCYEGPAGSSWLLAAEAYIHKWLRTYEKCVDRFLAPSQFVKSKLIENAWQENRIEVLPHFQHIPEEVAPNLGAKAPVVYFGRLSAEKGVADLIRAMQRLPGIPLIIAGDGPQRPELQKLTRDLGMAHVSFTGHLHGSRLNALIASSRFTVLPSRAYETMGKSILESFAAGRTVIATDLGSRRELIEEGKTGLLFRPGDTGQLEQVIAHLYHSCDLSVTMGNAAREFVRQEHSQASHYQRLLAVYEKLVEANRVRHEKPLRVAFIGGRGVISKYSGIETYYEEAGKELVRRGHQITVYCRSYFTPATASHNGIRLVRLPTIRTKHLETIVHTFLSTLHALFSGYDVVHYHALGPALLSFFPRIARKKTVVTIQGLDWQRAKWGWAASKVLQLGERAAVSIPDATMVVSRTLKNRFRNEAQIRYVPNGALIRERVPSTHCQALGLASREYILYLGRLSPEKNCHLLIEAYQRLRDRNPGVRVKLVLAGGSSYSKSYVTALRAHESEHIRILDWVSGEVFDELLTNACLFVLPSEMEGLSLALLDAMAAGVCVLASDIPENREAIDGAGYTFSSGDVVDLERMMRILINNAELRQAAAQNAKERIRSHYLWPQIAEQIEQVYFDVTGRGQSSAKCKPAAPDVPSAVASSERIA